MNNNRTLMTPIFKISNDLICEYQLNPCLAGRQVCHLRSMIDFRVTYNIKY